MPRKIAPVLPPGPHTRSTCRECGAAYEVPAGTPPWESWERRNGYCTIACMVVHLRVTEYAAVLR